jgi:hypothetical protein
MSRNVRGWRQHGYEAPHPCALRPTRGRAINGASGIQSRSLVSSRPGVYPSSISVPDKPQNHRNEDAGIHFSAIPASRIVAVDRISSTISFRVTDNTSEVQKRCDVLSLSVNTLHTFPVVKSKSHAHHAGVRRRFGIRNTCVPRTLPHLRRSGRTNASIHMIFGRPLASGDSIRKREPGI